MIYLPLYLYFSQTYISAQDEQLQLSPPEGPTSLQYNVLVQHQMASSHKVHVWPSLQG